MVLTEKQEKALQDCISVYKNRKKNMFIVAGYAGTGKSTLVKFIIDALQLSSDDVCYATFTGKAAEVLRKKGNKNACTLHKLLYNFYPKKNGEFVKIPKPKLDYQVVVIDEISMAPQSMMSLLLNYGVFVIGLGDPFQLPPVSEDDSNHYLDNPDVFLDEIMRQAEDSGIIRLSMKIRNGEPIEYGHYGDVDIIRKADVTPDILCDANQILVATNNNRNKINRKMRELYGFSGSVRAGEKVICLRNYWNFLNENHDPLVNGTICKVDKVVNSSFEIPYHIKSDTHNVPVCIATLNPNIYDESALFNSVSMDSNMLQTGRKTLNFNTESILRKKYPDIAENMPLEFEFGYAITVHKAQGSEWDNVLIFEEFFPTEQIEHARWLYTAVTRASQHVTIVR